MTKKRSVEATATVLALLASAVAVAGAAEVALSSDVVYGASFSLMF